MKVLVAGGAGYIGSTVCAALADSGHMPIILDSLISGKQEFTERYISYRGDIDDLCVLNRIVRENGSIDCVIHLAGLIIAPESTERTYEYYRENVTKTIDFLYNLLQIGCKKIIYSSSAAVYGNAQNQSVDETAELNPSSPYARTKTMVESIIQDYCACYDIRGIALRYFNPIGADPKMRSGSYMKNPSHLLGSLLTALHTDNKQITITGTNWNTRDGSGLRDYIHVWDLAKAHVCAVERIDTILSNEQRFMPINIGRGEGITVKEFIGIFESIAGVKMNIRYGSARPGDVSGAYALCERAKVFLDWQAELTIEEAIRDSLKWESLKNKL